MDERFDKLEGKLDKLDERLDNVDKHLAVYNEQLGYHIRRTNILERKLEPVEDHVKFINGLIKVLLGIGGLTAFFKLFF